jgi:hypothetical protein
MTQSQQLAEDDAWILFRLNSDPILTESDGAFDCFALMDVASCFIFGTELVAIKAIQLSQFQSRRLLISGRTQANKYPKMLMLSKRLAADTFVQEALREGIQIERVLSKRVLSYISEAKIGFRQYQESGSSGP